MLVSEIRDVLKKYEANDLRLLVTEMYKSMPKKLREEKGIDALLQDFTNQIAANKIEKTVVKIPNVSTLKMEIDLFIQYAYKQYYFAPNSYVHKKVRPKWRFMVKSYFNDLQLIPMNSADGEIATSLMDQLFAMLSYACGYYIFNTEDPFKSVGYGQTELFDIIVKRKVLGGIRPESLKSAILLAINSNVDRGTLNSYFADLLIANLKTNSAKELAIEQCAVIKTEMEKSRPQASKKTSSFSRSEYRYQEKVEYLVEMVFKLYLELCEYDTASKYFHKNYLYQTKEISLYVMLGILRSYDLKDFWLSEYKNAVYLGVKPRESLLELNAYMRKHDKFPDNCDYLYND